MVSLSRRLAASTLISTLCLASALTVSPAQAGSKQQTLVDRATLAVQDIFQGTTPSSRAQRYLAKARAVMVCPSVFRMSIVFGGAGGGCLLLSRDARGSWSDPAFYTLSSASMGLQLGVESSELMFFVMSDRGLQALLDSQFKFAAGASASFANMGSGIESGSAGASNTDILALQNPLVFLPERLWAAPSSQSTARAIVLSTTSPSAQKISSSRCGSIIRAQIHFAAS